MGRTLAVLLAASSLLLAGSAAAKSPTVPRHDGYPLHAGSHGQRVQDLQWLLGGHRPYVFSKVKPTYRWKPNGAYGARTKHAVKAMKYRIGYPAAGQCSHKRSTVTDTAGSTFTLILEGKLQRPICWVAVAQLRIQLVEPGVSPAAWKIKELELSQLGTAEIPAGSNRGPRISYTSAGYGPYQGATGAFGLAWCASFQQWAFSTVTGATFADRSAGVLYIEAWAQRHGYLNAKAKVGSLVAFLDDGGHIGYVSKVLASGYVALEGNSGDAVRQVFHPWNYRLRVFINIPGVA